MKVRDSISIVLVALGLGLLFGPGLGQERPLAIATTSLLADFAETVGGDRIEVYTITPSGICPAHYDIKPSDVRAIAQASLVLYHGIESWLDDLITASGNADVKRVQLKGPWNVPSLAAEKVGLIGDALGGIAPDDAEYFSANAEALQEAIDGLAQELLTEAEGLNVNEAKAIVMQWQEGFVG